MTKARQTLLWNTLLGKIVVFISRFPNDPESQKILAAVKASDTTLFEFIYGIDIRQVGELRKAFPQCFPRAFRGNVRLVGEQNIHGRWRITLSAHQDDRMSPAEVQAEELACM